MLDELISVIIVKFFKYLVMGTQEEVIYLWIFIIGSTIFAPLQVIFHYFGRFVDALLKAIYVTCGLFFGPMMIVCDHAVSDAGVIFIFITILFQLGLFIAAGDSYGGTFQHPKVVYNEATKMCIIPAYMLLMFIFAVISC